MTDSSAPTAMPAVVDRANWEVERDELLAREKAHTREGDAIAAARRLHLAARRERETPAGLAAFEGAPCYRELIERERGV